MKKRGLALALTLCMLLTLLPTVALGVGAVTLKVKSDTTDDTAPRAEGATYKTVQGAVAKAEAGDTIKIESDITSTSEIVLEKELTIDGGGHTLSPETTGLTAQGVVQTGSNYNVIQINSDIKVTIKNLTIMGGSKSAIYNEGKLTMEDVTVTRAGKGGIHSFNAKGTDLILKNCDIIRNASDVGGGMYVYKSIVVMDGCTFSENRSTGGGGGAIENTLLSTMYINNSVISNNSSKEIGGGINNNASTLYLMNSTVAGNVTTEERNYGGGIGNHGYTRTGQPEVPAYLYAVNSIIADNYSLESDVTPSDITCAQNTTHVSLYNCAYGTLANLTLEGDTGNKDGDTAKNLFAGYVNSGVIAANGKEEGTQYPRPVLLNNPLHAPLKAASNALTGGVTKTYFDYTDLEHVKMSYQPDGGSDTGLDGLATGGTEVTTYIEGGTRAAGVMGASAETATKYYTLKLVPVANGTATGGTVYGDTYAKNTPVELTAIPNSGYKFQEWIAGGVSLSTDNPYTHTVTADVSISPVFAALPKYYLTIDLDGGVGGTASGNQFENAEVAIDAGTKDGYVLDKWTSSNGGTFDDETSATTTFTMPAAATTVTATWKIPTYALTVVNGGVGSTVSGNHAAGAVSINAGTKAGYDFAGWTSSGGGSFADATSASTTFTMPANATTITASWTAQGGGSSGDSYVPPKKDPIIIDGKTENIGTETKKGTETTVTADQTKLTEKIEKAEEKGSVLVPVSKNETATASLVVKNVEDMAQKEMTLSVKTGGVTYDLPTTAMDVAALVAAFPGADTSEIPFDVTIQNADVTVKDTEIIVKPIDFTITATHGKKTVTVDNFSAFVPRTFEITKAQAQKITTAVVVEPDGTQRHVPTYVTEKDGKYYATVKSMTNSVYTLIWNEKIFPDAAGKWYEDVANEMGSRKIMVGNENGDFQGDEKVTRAEFAAMIVRALGFAQDKTDAFTDVTTDAWHYGYIRAASARSIVQGIGDNRFAPEGLITRQEAMQMLYNASKLTGFPTLLNARNLAAEFSDFGTVSDWAAPAVAWSLNNNLYVNLADTLNPGEEITRGEMSAMILKLLQRSELVDVRSQM